MVIGIHNSVLVHLCSIAMTCTEYGCINKLQNVVPGTWTMCERLMLQSQGVMQGVLKAKTKLNFKFNFKCDLTWFLTFLPHHLPTGCTDLKQPNTVHVHSCTLYSCKEQGLPRELQTGRGVLLLSWKKNSWQWDKPPYEIHRGYPCLHFYTKSWPKQMEWEWHVNQAYVTICISPLSCSIHWSGISEFKSSAQFCSNLSAFKKALLSWVVCVNTLKSFLLMQGTIKLSNGHNHYVKCGLYCQQFEHCWLPESADKMSGAQYFKAIKLSAFLFSLITF